MLASVRSIVSLSSGFGPGAGLSGGAAGSRTQQERDSPDEAHQFAPQVHDGTEGSVASATDGCKTGGHAQTTQGTLASNVDAEVARASMLQMI